MGIIQIPKPSSTVLVSPELNFFAYSGVQVHIYDNSIFLFFFWTSAHLGDPPTPPPEYFLFSFVYSTTPSPLCLALSVFLFLSVNSTQADLNSTSFVYSSTQPDFMSPPHTNHLLASLFVVIGSQKGSYITFNFSR